MRMSLIILGYNLVLVLLGLWLFGANFEFGYYSLVEYSAILQIYLFLAMIEFCLVLFVVPAFTAGAIAGEREKQTLEILLTTKLKPGAIIRGKLMSSISSTLLLIFSSLPVFGLVFSVGGIRMIDLLQLMLFCIVTAVFVGSIGLFFSSLSKKTVPATVLTYGTIILMVVGTVALTVICANIMNQSYLNRYFESGSIGEISQPGVGHFILVLLVNPAISLISLLSRQFGSYSYLEDFLLGFGNTSPFIYEHWFWISTGVQLAISALLLWGAARKLEK